MRAMATTEEIARAKDTLPRGWGRFGKAIDHIAGQLADDEPLLAVVVAIDPALDQGRVPGGHASALAVFGAMKRTNVVLGATDRRILVVATAILGGPRETAELDYDGLTIAPGAKETGFSMTLAGAQVDFSGAAKTQLPAFVETVTAHAR